jgi:2-oxoacid:acceptor oxidoreductase delta subunit (pyruvate/2-ketoisovalerate family)
MSDLPFAISLGPASSLENHTGSWRVQQPRYVSLQPPCATACPAGEAVQKWLYDAEDGSYEAAWRTVMAQNPFPAVMGRVCYHPCETACNRGQLDEAVGINAVERFLGDLALENGWTVPVTAAPTGKHVLVVGAGPCGLAAAYHLRLLGHDVTVRDCGERAGGMMRYGIPRYRLPREVLDGEIARIVAMGVRLELGSTVTDVGEIVAGADFDAVFLAVGAQTGRRAYLPAADSAHVLDAVRLLRDVEDAQPPQLGRRVVVYGGGNTAVDAARTARRLGATEAVILYRRTRDRMPAEDSEVQEAEEEGVLLRWLSTIKHVDVGRIQVERMELDENGFPQPTGEVEELESDAVVLALGQESDLGLVAGAAAITTEDGVVVVDDRMMTGLPGVFAGGDMVAGARTVTSGVGQGTRAAQSIDAWLRAREPEPEPEVVPAEFSRLNTWYYSEAPHAVRPRLEAARRASNFAEVVSGLDAATALYEARRCLSCGNCFECDNCFGVCPDNAVIKLGPGQGFAIDLDYCKGCGLCAVECPAGAIEMVPEET